MAHIAISVDWYDPYASPKEASGVKDDYAEGLYVAVGRKQKNSNRHILYIGVGDNPAERVTNNHKTLKSIKGPFQLWLGEISTAGKPGPKRIKRTTTVDLAETALTYGLQPKLNSDKKKHPPESEVTVLSRWWRKDIYDVEFNKRPHKKWADVVDYRGEEYGVRLGWAQWYST